jgi:hypothetical protein
MQNYQNNALKWVHGLILAFFVILFWGFTHPFYLSVTEINYNPDSKRIELSVRMFTDDFENALRAQYKQSIDLINPKDINQMNQFVREYIGKNLEIIADGKPVPVKFLGYEKDQDVIWSYFESEELLKPGHYRITNTLLYQHIESQSNIIHCNHAGQKKSYKLNNPDKVAEFQF